MGNASKIADGLERALWTVLEGATATGIVAGYQALPLPNVPDAYLPLIVIVVAGVLAAIKSALAQKFGNGTAATLPTNLEPIPNVVPKINTDNEVPGELDLNNDGRDDRTGRFVRRQK